MTLDEIRAAYNGMSIEERRTALPAWFPGEFDPSHPEWHHLYDDDTMVGYLIAEGMRKFEDALPIGRRRSKLDWIGPDSKIPAAIQKLIEACRIVYFPAYHDWLAKNAPQGSRWRPHRSFSKNLALQDDPEHDYRDFQKMAEEVLRRAYQLVGFPDVPKFSTIFVLDHEKGINPATGRRPSKIPPMQYGLGIFMDRPIGTAPMAPVYALTKSFFVKKLGMRAFHPVFPFADDEVAERRPLPDGRAERYVGEVLHVTLPAAARGARIKRDDMNTAAKFLSLVLKEVDRHFSARHAGLVARAFYKRSK